MTHPIIKKESIQETELNITPMIDVTFLLLIFFMCSIKFKLLDGKLSAYLPRDCGVAHTREKFPIENIEIALSPSNAPCGFTIHLNGRKKAGLERLYQELKVFYHSDKDLRITIESKEGTRYGHVIRTVNECVRAGYLNITFVQTDLDG